MNINSRVIKVTFIGAVLICVFSTGCQLKRYQEAAMPQTFGDDLEFLRRYVDVIVLSDGRGQAQVAVCPAYQGRVMTSTAAGARGTSFGWINRELIASGRVQQHINVYGGEDRFWLGPEGGQFSIFFKKDAPFDLEHWFTPAPIDTQPFHLMDREHNRAEYREKMQMVNYSDTQFDLEVKRVIGLLSPENIAENLGILLSDSAKASAYQSGGFWNVPPDSPKEKVKVKAVAYQSENTITNIGKNAWTKESGMLSIWILGMFNPSEATTIAIPYNSGSESELGPMVNDAYFGKVPAERLVVKEGVIYFSGDGRYRSKIGLTPQRAKNVLGSYDAAHGTLTIVQYNKPEGVGDYVNSMWEIQEQPFGGDVVNSYNDGPPAPGAKPLGPFYELETSSCAAALKPGDSITHIHCTYHFQGTPAQLNRIAKPILGVTVEQIAQALR